MSGHGVLIVLSAPSGGGKSTIARWLLAQYPQIHFSVSATTRAMRPGEQDGKEYYFLSKPEFQERVRRGELIEWEEIYGDYYGTLRSEALRSRTEGRPVLFDIDVKGGLSIQRAFPEESILIFIAPPSFEVLAERLRNRKTESEEALAKRLARVQMELEEGKKFRHTVINDDLNRAIAEVDGFVRPRIAGMQV